ncbi:ParA family protein [Alkanindiges sp. WGS2144]|uniref:ParA family protein n=1 Tax=Alkanindiges sp. WGS2144 TaxID=3366808 RepID=UPI003752B716
MRRVVFNQKGGVGKSSITVNLAAISAARGKRTLVIDLDPQSNSSQYLLGEKATYGQNNPVLEPNVETFFDDVLNATQGKGLIGSALGSILKQKERGLDVVIHGTPFDNLFVIPSSPNLGSLEHALQSKHKIFKLRDALNELASQYDEIFIDTPPAFNFFTLSALIAADRVVIPFDCDVFSRRALLTLLENVVEAKGDHNPRLEVEGIVVNQFQSQAKLPQQVVQELKDEGLPVFNTMLPSSVVMKESHQKNKPLIHLNKDHKLTQAYVNLFDEISPA